MLANVYVAPSPAEPKDNGLERDMPFVFIVNDPVVGLQSKLIEPNVIPEPKVIFALTSIVPFVPALRVPVNPEVLKLRQAPPPVLRGTIADPLFASKKTSSEVVGTAAPPIPPEVVDHFNPAVPSQALVSKSTQYLLAIL